MIPQSAIVYFVSLQSDPNGFPELHNFDMESSIFGTGVNGYKVALDGVRAMASALVPHLCPRFPGVTNEAVAAVMVWRVAL